jgi:hypothetical protein
MESKKVSNSVGKRDRGLKNLELRINLDSDPAGTKRSQVTEFEAGRQSDATPQEPKQFNVENTLEIEEKIWSSLEIMRYVEQQNEPKISQMKVRIAAKQMLDSEIIQLEDLRVSFGEVSKLAEAWWESTHSWNLNHLDSVFGKAKEYGPIRRAVRQSLILENVLMTLLYTLFCQMKEITEIKLAKIEELFEEKPKETKTGEL